MRSRETFQRITYRIEVLEHWISGRRNGVSSFELLRFLTARSSVSRAKQVIEHVSREGNFFVVTLKGLEHPLYYPAELPLTSLYMPVSQILCPPDWHEYEVGQTFVRPEDVVIDCGSAEGLFSLIVCGRCERVYAIEPLPRFVEALGFTFKDIDNVEVVPCALSDRVGQGHLSNRDMASTLCHDEESELTVPLDTIDELFFSKGEKVDYIKADVEGSEIEMLHGGERTIREYTPRIAITTYHCERHAREIDAFLRGLDVGYKTVCSGIEGKWGGPKMLHAWV